jgi:hypothetical protein
VKSKGEGAVKQKVVITWTSLAVLSSLSASAGIAVMVTATTSGFPTSTNTSHLEYESTIVVTNDLPAYYLGGVSWYIDRANDDCFWINRNTVGSYCCVFYGSSRSVNISEEGVPCPIAAHCESFGYAFGATDFRMSNCVVIPCREPPDINLDPNSPIILSMSDQRIELTDLAGGVRFDLNRDGSPEQISWTASTAVDDAFLVLDRNGNNVIDDGGELFGDASPQPPGGVPNGFRALAVFDEVQHGGNGDGYISAADSVFALLRLWYDWNHDGVSQGSEMRTLESEGVERISLDYLETSRRDKYGNEFKFQGKAIHVNGRHLPIWDVYFLR